MPTNAESAGSAHNAEVSVVENNGPAEAATLPDEKVEVQDDPRAEERAFYDNTDYSELDLERADDVQVAQLPGDQVVRQPTADQEGEIVATRDDDDE